MRVQVAATTLHHKSLQQQPSEKLSTTGPDLACPADGRQQLGVGMPSGSSQGLSGGVGQGKAAELALKREDEELQQKRALERRGLPNNVDGFK